MRRHDRRVEFEPDVPPEAVAAATAEEGSAVITPLPSADGTPPQPRLVVKATVRI